jgi:glycosyltransferase involved in cell wall biosynthesis
MFFDPYNVEEMAEMLWCLLKEPDLRQELAIKGLKRAEEFSWERCAAATLQVYEEAVSSQPSAVSS